MKSCVSMPQSFKPMSNIAPGERTGNPLQYSCLENPMDGGVWWTAVHGVPQSWTRLKRLSMHACIGGGNGNPLQYSCLENPGDRGAWWAADYGVAQSRTRLKQLSSSSSNIAPSIDYSLWDPFTDGQILWLLHGCLLLPALCLHLFTKVFCTVSITNSCCYALFYYPRSNGFLFVLPSVLPSCLCDMIHIACLFVWTENWCRFMLELLILIWGPLSTILLYALICRRIISHFLENICNFLIHSA